MGSNENHVAHAPDSERTLETSFRHCPAGRHRDREHHTVISPASIGGRLLVHSALDRSDVDDAVARIVKE